jgi:hypothetical protein
MTKPAMIFDIPGAAWSWFEGSSLYQEPENYVEPDASDRAASLEAGAALKAARRHPSGFGHSYRVRCSREAARIIREHADYHPAAQYGADSEERAEINACRRVVERISRRLDSTDD